MTGETTTSASHDAASGGPSDSHSKTDMTIDEQLIKAEELKSLGNKAYEQEELSEALKQWHHVSAAITVERLQLRQPGTLC